MSSLLASSRAKHSRRPWPWRWFGGIEIASVAGRASSFARSARQPFRANGAVHPDHSAFVEPVRPAPSRLVATAVEIIESDARLPLSVSSIAARCHGSVRSLQQAFRREMEMTPMEYLREVRLRRAHRALVESDPSVSTVASIAHGWGFTNLGRFAETHMTRYGESPGVTLRRTLFPH
jgi:transcriptional regulator GlxA family with amidase domain